ncbi:hypothetical protein [Terrisporobacter hibernicus]|uniref:Uncharacterized protein n=1 Tax=Terrisporobacter hibernicus TaxID=2813371 RepID=A0AAX2ZHN5_9FIRM|nr:hypothetical protein [Terrisporobacter hibernicus]UEL48677.1 hypothetical protein JW646_04265 [Terrisporobacter hibernicus]
MRARIGNFALKHNTKAQNIKYKIEIWRGANTVLKKHLLENHLKNIGLNIMCLCFPEIDRNIIKATSCNVVKYRCVTSSVLTVLIMYTRVINNNII